MKKCILFLILCVLMFPFAVNKKQDGLINDIALGEKSSNSYSFTTFDGICENVKNKVIQVGIVNEFASDSELKNGKNLNPGTDSCDNKSQQPKDESNIPSWTRYGKESTNILVDDAKKSYVYFYINNRMFTKFSSININSLKPSEKIYIDIDLKDMGETLKNGKDVRVTINYLNNDNDIIISRYNSIGYYLYGKNGTVYGPYKMSDVQMVRIGYDDKNMKYVEYQAVSENLIKNEVKSFENITKIRIIPYDFYPVHAGSFKLYSISIDNYANGYKNNKEYINVSGAEDKIRHNIVNNMIANATLKWKINQNNNINILSYYSYIDTSPRKYENSNYGLPYVNTIKSTIESFISHAPKINGIYQYNLPNKYLKDTTSSKGKSIKKGDSISGNTMYVYEKTAAKDNTGGRKSNLEKYDYVSNDGYLFGQDCSSSTFYSVAKELPYVNSLTTGIGQIYNSQTKLLGGVEFNHKVIEKYIRNKGIENEIGYSLLQDNYTGYIKSKGINSIYNGYGLLKPGDVVMSSDHVRMATGYSVVVCKDGTTVGGNRNTKYSDNYCNNHGGIDSNKSYAIITEILYVAHEEHASVNDTGWKNIQLDKTITDLKNIDYYWKKKNGKYEYNPDVDRNFNVNAIYYFIDLAGEKDENSASAKHMYLPLRYIMMDNVVRNKNIEKPEVRYVLDENYSANQQNSILYDYTKAKGQLKGTLLTNYVIDGIKIEIKNSNNASYVKEIYPKQTNQFSFYYDIDYENDNELCKKLKNAKEIIIKIKMGPTDITEVKNVVKADNDGYFEVVKIKENSSSSYLTGDVDGNGKVETLDYLKVRKHIISTKLSGEELKRADVNGDGSIDTADYVAIRRIVMKL